MFGKNEIVGQKYFKDAPEDHLMVTSMFWSIQGEGPFMGQPAYFFRLSKCQLRCQFCDSFFDKGEYYHINDLLEMMRIDVNKYYNDKGLQNPVPYGQLVVITGGEPTLQPNLFRFIEHLQNNGYIVQIETNGILDINVPFGTTVVCSPKCSEKTGKYLNISKQVKGNVNSFKFVVSADPDSPYHKIPDWVQEEMAWACWNVYISPMNVYKKLPEKAKGTGSLNDRSTKDEVISFWETDLLDLEQNRLNHEYAARYCMENGFNLNLQMHLYASLA